MQKHSPGISAQQALLQSHYFHQVNGSCQWHSVKIWSLMSHTQNCKESGETMLMSPTDVHSGVCTRPTQHHTTFGVEWLQKGNRP